MFMGIRSVRRALALVAVASLVPAGAAWAQGPQVLDRNLGVRTAASGLNQPVSMAFIDTGDMLVLEKGTGQVKRVVNGTVQGVVLDLPVNSNSERGLLGIALHPQFDDNGFVYLFWSESNTGADSTSSTAVDLMANRVDRFRWTGSQLVMDRPIIRFRAFQHDAGQNPRGNHNGGVLRFGSDGKLYAIVGDTGRRGQTQNLLNGPFGPGQPDDQFGGPEPDDAHRTGVIVRLNDDGSTPTDNPFFAEGAAVGGEVGANIQRIFSYGIRNSFGMAVDPVSGTLWQQENGDDSFSELNRVTPGQNSGWVQIMGPASRVAQFKEIETSPRFFGLQQIRWSPTNIADTPEEALSRMVSFGPAAHFSDPELAWKFEVGPGGIGFLEGRALGPQYRNDLFVGGSRDFLEGGHLFRIQLTGNRRKVAVDDPRLEDRVADNLDKWEGTESESLRFGTGFGIGTDIHTGPDGNLYVVSLSHGAVYEIFRR
jgi:glucose/arabinose dehydrogenase